MNRRAAGLVFLLFVISLVCTSFVKADYFASTTAADLEDGRKSHGDGSVLALPGDMKEVVIAIDPGHGGEDDGACYGNLKEKDISLDVSLRFADILRQKGFKVVLTRQKDVLVELRDRADMANKVGANLFFSIHINKLPSDPSWKGTETLYAPHQPLVNGLDSKKFAKIVQNELAKSLNTVNGGIKSRPSLAVLHRTDMPAVIAEIAYISNNSDREKLKSSQFRQKAAEALARAAETALDKMGMLKDKDGRWMIPLEDGIKK